ncbi:MAG: universal stress protein [Gammaproteobacteria bacterium]
MSIADLLLHVDTTKSCESRLRVALELAQRHDAHVMGAYVYPRMQVPVGFSGELPQAYIDLQREAIEEDEATARAAFETAAQAAGVRYDWRAQTGNASDVLNALGRSFDLVVVGQYNDEASEQTPPGLPDDVVMECGRPVLVVPYIGAASTPGKHVIVAWNGSHEAGRALNDALPLLEGAEQVHALVFGDEPPAFGSADGGISTNGAQTNGASDMSLHLARHGVDVNEQRMPANDVEVGELLLSRAADLGADLIVMGAYGHSRLREWILGGVTRTVLGHMTVPVLLSH